MQRLSVQRLSSVSTLQSGELPGQEPQCHASPSNASLWSCGRSAWHKMSADSWPRVTLFHVNQLKVS